MFGIARLSSKRLLFAVAALSLGQAVVLLIVAWSIRYSFLLLNGEQNVGFGGLVVVVLAVALLTIFLQVFQRNLSVRLVNHYIAEVRDKLLRKLGRLSQKAFDDKQLILVFNKLTGDLTALRAWVQHGPSAILNFVFVIPATYLAFSNLAPTLVNVAMLIVVTSVGFSTPFLFWNWGAHVHLRKIRGQTALRLYYSLNQFAALRVAGGVNAERRWLQQRGEVHANAQLKRSNSLGIALGLAQASRLVGFLILLWISLNENLPSSVLASSFAVLGIATYHLQRLIRAIESYGTYRAAIMNLERTSFGNTVPRVNRTNSKSTLDDRQAIRVSVTNAQISLNQKPLSFKCRPGDTFHLYTGDDCKVATDFLKCVEGSECLQSGLIKLENRNISSFSWSERSRLIHKLDLSPLLVRGSVRKNIVLGVGRVEDDMINDALRLFELYGLVNNSGGLERRLGHPEQFFNGLSAWKLSCVRAYLKNPPLVLVDLPFHLNPEPFMVLAKTLRQSSQSTWIVAGGHNIESLNPLTSFNI